MNRFYLFILMILFSGSMYGQQDNQWLVKGGYGKDGSSTSGLFNYSNVINEGHIKIDGVKYPLAANNAFTLVRNYSNDFFAIFDDGSYHFGRYNMDDGNIGNNGNRYDFNALKKIEFLYLTNRYEEEDAPGLVKVSNGIITGIDYGEEPISDIFNFNHDIVGGNDITMIIDGNRLNSVKRECNGYEFKLCYTAPLGIRFEASNFNNISNVLYQETISSIDILKPSISTINFIDTCFSFSSIGNMFINFKSLIDDKSAINDSVQFNLSCDGTIIESHSELIAGYAHDPNFIRLNSICEIGNDMYANYTIQVQNDGEISTTDVSLNIDFPDCIDVNNIYTQSYHYSNIYSYPIRRFPNDLLNTIDQLKCKVNNNNNMTFSFPKDWPLANDTNRIDPLSIASFTICAKVKPSCVPSFLSCDDCTIPTLANSSFEDKDYPINLIIDLPKTVKIDSNENQIYVRPISDQCDCNLDHKCPSCVCPYYFYCPCERSIWVDIVFTIGLLLVIGWLIRRFRN